MLRRLIAYLFFLAFAALVFAFSQFWIFYHKPIIHGASLTFQIKPGTPVRQVLFSLNQNQQVKSFSPLWFELFVRLKGLEHAFKAGEYRLPSGTTGADFVHKVVAGEVVQYAQTIIEGWTFVTLFEQLHQNPAIVKTMSLEQANLLSAKLGTQSLSLEGWFFPETYYFPQGTTDVEFLKRAYQLMNKRLAVAWEARDKDSILKTPYEALILASIIEKESSLAGEWPYVSQVFHNRLKKGMRLQADPTVIYGLGVEFDGDIKRADLRRPTPYNSYLNKGLPPTPIAMPGFGALLSAVRPAPGDYLYFVAKGDGSHHFSSTLEEHEAMVDKYIKGKP